MLKKYKEYIYSILIALAVSGLSALVTRNDMDLYSSINTPPLSPPSWLFPIVWTILFVLMGISSAVIYKKRKENYDLSAEGLLIYTVSLVFNFLWSVIFFKFRAFLLAFIWLLILWLLILFTILKYRRLSAFAAYLQIPYFLWVTFAAYLNLAIYLLNK